MYLGLLETPGIPTFSASVPTSYVTNPRIIVQYLYLSTFSYLFAAAELDLQFSAGSFTFPESAALVVDVTFLSSGLTGIDIPCGSIILPLVYEEDPAGEYYHFHRSQWLHAVSFLCKV